MKVLYVTVNSLERPLTGHDIRISSQLRALSQVCELETLAISDLTNSIDVGRSSALDHSAESNNSIASQIMGGKVKPFSYRRTDKVLTSFHSKYSNKNFDALIFSGLESTAIYQDIVAAFPYARKILDLDESCYRWNESFLEMPVSSTQRMVWKNYFPKLQELEDSLIDAFDQVWVCSPIELETISKRHPDHKGLHIIQNGLLSADLRNLSPMPEVSKTILYVGSFAHLPNQFAVKELVNEIMPLLPDFKLEVVGRDIPSSWLAQSNDKIRYFSSVLDLEPHYRRALATVLPLRAGAGTRIKVLEAINFGIPIISTSFGVEGIGLVENEHYLRAESPNEFASQITRLVNDPNLISQLRENGYKLFNHKFSKELLEQEIARALFQSIDSNNAS